MMGIEPMSENPLTKPSPWAVCYLEFPLGSANRHAILWVALFCLTGSRANHRCKFTAQMTFSLPSQSSAEERVTRRSRHCQALRRSVKLRQPLQLESCRLFFKVRQFTRLPGSPRLSCLRIPVETIAPPFSWSGTVLGALGNSPPLSPQRERSYIILYFFPFVKSKSSPNSHFNPSATPNFPSAR